MATLVLNKNTVVGNRLQTVGNKILNAVHVALMKSAERRVTQIINDMSDQQLANMGTTRQDILKRTHG